MATKQAVAKKTATKAAVPFEAGTVTAKAVRGSKQPN